MNLSQTMFIVELSSTMQIFVFHSVQDFFINGIHSVVYSEDKSYLTKINALRIRRLSSAEGTVSIFVQLIRYIHTALAVN